MITNYTRLRSGEEYTLNQLFNGKNRIVIPDLQRDYCGGDKAWNKDAKNYTELVSGFVDSLISFFQEKPAENLTLGLIYGYEHPHSHIQLCDGQQRLTTLFLLMGMLNKKTANQFKTTLISEAELADDKEPNLQYAIRESTLYFLSDLVCAFFLKKDTKIEEIQKQSWYFKEYDLDASIQSMLSAIKIINGKLEDLDCVKFGKFILNNLQILYYDMGHRTRGEETFVVINTTGEPLTATENLKPILIGNIKEEETRKKASNEWEDREEWFWQNRKKDDEQTSDKGLNDFFVWYWQICLLQEKSWKGKNSYEHNPNELFQKKPKNIEAQGETLNIEKWEEGKNLDTVHPYFTALQNLVEKCKEDKVSKVLKTIENKEITLSWFRGVSLEVILPLIAYIQKFPNHQNLYQFVRRIRKNHFDKKWEDRKPNFVDWRYLIQIIQLSETEEDVLKYETKINEAKFKKIQNVPLNEWYNEEEKLKDSLKEKHQKEIENWEEHKDFRGDLSFFISDNQNQANDNRFETLQKRYNNYVSVIDLIRAKKAVAISNTFRLFLLYLDCEKVESKSRVAWHIHGVLFSSISNRNHLHKELFKQLCFQAENNLEQYCLPHIKTKIKEWDLFNLNENNFKTDRALKCWLTLKVFYANEKNICLEYYDGDNGEGVSVNINPNSNKLVGTESFSIYNMICGFGVPSGWGKASYINYTNNNLWLKTNIIDTPFSGIIFDKDKRTQEQLEENKSVIDDILKAIL